MVKWELSHKVDKLVQMKTGEVQSLGLSGE